MLSIPRSSFPTQRSSAFSTGNSPEIAGLRINSFIDRLWESHPDIQALSQSLCGIDTNTTDEPRDRSEIGISYKRFSFAGSNRSSIPSTEENLDLQDQVPETPVLEMARVQTHRVLPVSNLVYISESNHNSKFREIESISLPASKFGRNTGYMEATPTYSDDLENDFNPQKPIPTSTHPQPVHCNGPPLMKTQFDDSIDRFFLPSSSMTPTKQIRCGQQGIPTGSNPHSNDSLRRGVWPCQYSPAKAPRIIPPISVRDSSLQHGQSSVAQQFPWDDFAFDLPVTEAKFEQDLTANIPSRLGSSNRAVSLPLPHSVNSHHDQQHNGNARMGKHILTQSDNPSNLPDGSSHTAVENTVASDNTVFYDSSVSSQGVEKFMSKSRLRSWLLKCYRSSVSSNFK